jgi:hypothetical protein
MYKHLLMRPALYLNQCVELIDRLLQVNKHMLPQQQLASL